jgi:hypothetical protein
LLARDIEGFSESKGRGGVDICRLRAFATMADLCHRVQIVPLIVGHVFKGA